ncbi:DNase I-like protein, partial [Fistulina hepatica ATCC 64428]
SLPASPKPPPPRPPPRVMPKVSSSTPERTVPPPSLPPRRNTLTAADDLLNEATPRHSLFSKLPPPPTRTIAPGDKLPPPRRSTASSDDSDDDEEEEESHRADLARLEAMPDSSQSSRRPPILTIPVCDIPKIPVAAHNGHVLVTGMHVVVAHGHHSVKIYDLAASESPVISLGAKDLGVKDIKVTCMEVRHCDEPRDVGSLVWLGTKDGHIFEIDVRTGIVTDFRLGMHLYPVTHIFRHAPAMLSIDESGKVLVYAPSADFPSVRLSTTPPRVVRIAEKQDFVKMIDGKLWAADRAEQHPLSIFSGAHSTTVKTPIMRIYDVFTPGAVGKSALAVTPDVLSTMIPGAITSAAIVPALPGVVFVGHEKGFITVWTTADDNGTPRCLEVMKVSASDVLCMEGVNDRLWVGGRGGMITAYDVVPRPWVVTNMWNAHSGLPVISIRVDIHGIRLTGRLCVTSVGRDEVLRLWDGLLTLDCVDAELLKRETTFSSFRQIKALLVSWNIDSARPELLTGHEANVSFLHNVLTSVESPDIISFGFQEVIDLENRRMTAKNVLLKRGDDGPLNEKVTGAYRRWHDCLVLALKLAMPADVPYSIVHMENLVGLFTCTFIKNSERAVLKDVAITSGGIISRMVLEDTSICLINCHLAAGQHNVRARNADIAGMLENKAPLPMSTNPVPYVGGGDGSMVLDHEIVLVNGDMNYRIDHRREAIIAAINADDVQSLHAHDQLLKEMRHNRGFRFRGFSEGLLTFAPTYKYDRRSNEWDSSEKRRSPAWCDRVLWRSRVPGRVRQLHYRRYEANVSDHRPISAAFELTIKRVLNEVREQVKAEVEMQWPQQQAHLLQLSLDFYESQSML